MFRIRVYGHRIRVPGHRIRVSGHQIRVSPHRIRMSRHRIRISRHRIPASSHRIRFRLSGHQIRVFGLRIRICCPRVFFVGSGSISLNHESESKVVPGSGHGFQVSGSVFVDMWMWIRTYSFYDPETQNLAVLFHSVNKIMIVFPTR